MTRPIVSSGFGFDPFAMRSSIREFYERWHAQGGESARDHAGIMKRARDMPDLRTAEARREWETLDDQLRRNWMLLRFVTGLGRLTELTQEMRSAKASNVVNFKRT